MYVFCKSFINAFGKQSWGRETGQVIIKYYKPRLTNRQGEKVNEPEHTKHAPGLLHL